ncbi:hypothetical protein [Nocardia sp. NPDC050793]|uniref:hypothetical protein n=1 Tax=Nocardia sp. NPDC050793 TaxID=3155159 RepID=UPI0033CDA3F9
MADQLAGNDDQRGPCHPESRLEFDGLLHHRTRKAKTLATIPFQFPEALPRSPIGDFFYATTTLDNRGRLGNKSLFRMMPWTSSDRLTISVERRIPVIRRSRSGPFSIHASGFLYMPAAIRHGCALTAGERILLAAAPAQDVVAVYPPQAVAEALWGYGRQIWEHRP